LLQEGDQLAGGQFVQLSGVLHLVELPVKVFNFLMVKKNKSFFWHHSDVDTFLDWPYMLKLHVFPGVGFTCCGSKCSLGLAVPAVAPGIS
jgi:hypothetical protein